MNRRAFITLLSESLVSFALLESLFQTRAFGKAIDPIIHHWAVQLQEYCLDLKQSTITPHAWQARVEELFRQVPLEDVLRFIDFERLRKGFEFPDLGVNTKMVTFPSLEGLPPQTAFVKKIFGLQRERAIIPHGHSNMASAHLVLQGELDLKHYDKVAEEADCLIIRPTVDHRVRPGEISSISDEGDNVHWFIAQSPVAFTFDVILLDIGNQPYHIHNIDIEAATKTGHDCLRAPKLDVQTALKKYGKLHH